MPSGLDARHRAATRVAAIRSPYPGVDALAPTPDGAGDSVGRDAAGEQLAPVVHLADRAPRPVRDGATRQAHAPRIDAQNRVNLGKALTALGWTADTFLVAARENGHVVVRAGLPPLLLRQVLTLAVAAEHHVLAGHESRNLAGVPVAVARRLGPDQPQLVEGPLDPGLVRLAVGLRRGR
jgi:hypothetical protein